MTKESVQKLQAAGYVFIRARETEGKGGKKYQSIFDSREFGVWKLLYKCETKAECKRKLDELDADPMYILGITN